MPKILAIDTSTDACSAALLVNQKISNYFILTPKGHTNCILAMIEKLLAEAQLNLTQLDALACGYGPGSFTGVRLTISIIQGLAAASSVPVIGVSTLRTLATEVFTELHFPKVVVAQDARMQELYWGEYILGKNGIMQPSIAECLCKPELTKLNDAHYTAFVGVGSGFITYGNVLTPNSLMKTIDKQYVNARYILPLAAYDLTCGAAIAPEQLLPNYLREQVAWQMGARCQG